MASVFYLGMSVFSELDSIDQDTGWIARVVSFSESDVLAEIIRNSYLHNQQKNPDPSSPSDDDLRGKIVRFSPTDFNFQSKECRFWEIVS